MNELQIDIQQPGVIRLNYEEIKSNLAEQMEEYKAMTFDESSRVFAKNRVTDLRKMKKAIDDRRKVVKAEWLLPYNDFEAKAKELIALIEEPIELINAQVDVFERKRVEEKRTKIEALYNKLVGDMGEILPLETIFDSKWNNSSYTMKAIGDDITALVNQTTNDMSMISGMLSDAVPRAIELYKASRSLPSVMAYISQYERQKTEMMAAEKAKRQAEEEQRRQDEIERIRREERQRIQEEEQIRVEERRKIQEEAAAPVTPITPEETWITQEDTPDELPFQQPETRKVIYTVVATESELEAVEMAFNSLGIYFERREVRQ